jgi:deazaflavin-dependent oxidoreductase (nitroreductase family)
MPMPLWWGQINKRVFNPLSLRGTRYEAIRHVGRSSGREYRTPLEALPVDGGYVMMLVYGSKADWVQNVLAAGSASLEVDGTLVELADPQLLTADEAFQLLPAAAKRTPKALRIDEFLMMRTRESP